MVIIPEEFLSYQQNFEFFLYDFPTPIRLFIKPSLHFFGIHPYAFPYLAPPGSGARPEAA
jgi:hypothetical protein